jgi:hypothetical protein
LLIVLTLRKLRHRSIRRLVRDRARTQNQTICAGVRFPAPKIKGNKQLLQLLS